MVGDGEGLGGGVEVDGAEELQAGGRTAAALEIRRQAGEAHLGAEGGVEFIGSEGPGVERAADEFPERIEVAELGAVGRVVVGGGVVDVGGEPDEIADLGAVERAGSPPSVMSLVYTRPEEKLNAF